MKQVKTYPKFKCDFCKKRAVKAAMIKHEKICWYNPNRECRTCEGLGYTIGLDMNGYDTDEHIPCEDCERAKEIKLQKIREENRVYKYNIE